MVSHDRLSIAIFFMSTMHVFLILAIGFTSPPLAESDSATNQESTKLTTANNNTPDESSQISNLTNKGSGNDARAQDQASNIKLGKALTNGKSFQEKKSSDSKEIKKSEPISLLTNSNSPIVYYGLQRELNKIITTKFENISEMNFQIALNTLDLNIVKQYRALKPESVILSSSTSYHPAANYLQYWVRRIEQIGNEQYPTLALQKGITGEVIVLAVLSKDGTLLSSRILKSSGEKILDQSALTTIRISAPYNVFDELLSREVSRIEIIRTFSYQGKYLKTRSSYED